MLIHFCSCSHSTSASSTRQAPRYIAISSSVSVLGCDLTLWRHSCWNSLKLTNWTGPQIAPNKHDFQNFFKPTTTLSFPPPNMLFPKMRKFFFVNIVIALLFLHADAQCPCLCYLKSPKNFGYCKIFRHCRVLHCLRPHRYFTFFSCCDSSKKARIPPTIRQAIKSLIFIEKNAEEVAKTAPAFALHLVLILQRCIDDIEKLETSPTGYVIRQSARILNAFKRATSTNLLYISSSLEKNLI